MRTFFAFEQDLWAAQRGVALRLNPFPACGDASVLRRGKGCAPDNHRVIGPSVVHDGQRFIMWYTGLGLDRSSSLKDHRTIRHAQCIAYSEDGVHWAKPRLTPRRKGGARSNALFGGLFLAGVDYQPELERYVMALSYQNGRRREGGQSAFCIATSKDGLRWRRCREPASDLGHFESCTGPKRIGDRYWVVGQSISPFVHLPDGSPCGRVATGYSSTDLQTWTRHPAPLFHYPVHRLYPRACLQTHLGFTVWPRERIHLGFVGQFWPAGFSENVRFTVGLVYSYDGVHWTEPFPQTPVLGGPGFAGWHATVIQGNSLLNRGRETLFWYTGGDASGNTWTARTEIGLATIRRDGFAFFEAAGKGRPALVTAPIRLRVSDQALYVNATASRTNPLHVELLDRTGAPLPAARAVVTRGGVMVRALELGPTRTGPRRVRVRFRWGGTSRRGRLFGFHLGRTADAE